MSYIVLPAALEDLDYIGAWILTNFGELAALKAEAELYEVFDLLAEFPEMGKLRSELGGSRYRYFSSPPNWIVYEPGDPLLIHRIVAARMDIRELSLSRR